MIKNILSLALALLPKQEALLYVWQGRKTNAAGLEQSHYEGPMLIVGSFQPVERSRYEYYGLDTEKNYITAHVGALVHSLSIGKNPDCIEWQGRRYEIMGLADWKGTADFNGIMAVDIGPASAQDVQPVLGNSI